MCDFISGYQYPDGSLHFHTDDDVEAAWEREGRTEPIPWFNMVGHSGYRFCFGDPPEDSKEVEGLYYAVDVDLRRFRQLAWSVGYKSIVLNDPASVAKGLKLWDEGNKLADEGHRLWYEGCKLFDKWEETTKLRGEGRKLCFTIVRI